MLKVDLHMHTHNSPDSGAPISSIVNRCLQTGLNCIAVTDHNTIQGGVEVRDAAPFPVIVGEEVKSSAGDIIGLFLNETIPKGLSPRDTVDAIKSQGGLVLVPHPFDRFRSSAIGKDALLEILPWVDAIETFNGHNFLERDNRSAEEFTAEKQVIPAACSDSHTPLELGRTYMEMEEFEWTPEGFLDALSRANLVKRRCNQVHRLTPVAVKARRALGFK